MSEFTVQSIGKVRGGGEGPAVLELDPAYRRGLVGLEGFSHVVVAWWAHHVDKPELRSLVDAGRPYIKLSHDLGIFATRAPLRPNPIALSVMSISALDIDRGTVEVPYCDAEDNTPLLDIKPYTPSVDRVEHPHAPTWCAHWPQSVESSGNFDWAAEFTF